MTQVTLLPLWEAAGCRISPDVVTDAGVKQAEIPSISAVWTSAGAHTLDKTDCRSMQLSELLST